MRSRIWTAYVLIAASVAITPRVGFGQAKTEKAPDHTLTPAPMPQLMPNIDPAAREAGTRQGTASGPTNATPFSGPPPIPGSTTNQATPGGSQLAPDPVAPNVSR